MRRPDRPKKPAPLAGLIKLVGDSLRESHPDKKHTRQVIRATARRVHKINRAAARAEVQREREARMKRAWNYYERAARRSEMKLRHPPKPPWFSKRTSGLPHPNFSVTLDGKHYAKWSLIDR